VSDNVSANSVFLINFSSVSRADYSSTYDLFYANYLPVMADSREKLIIKTQPTESCLAKKRRRLLPRFVPVVSQPRGCFQHNNKHQWSHYA